jgi:signal recognition particle subunit SRP19
MRKQDKIIVWPTYFDYAKTRREGRRVTKNLAVPSPKVSEVKAAADRLRLNCQLITEVAFPKMPWSKSGSILVQKKQSKEVTIREIAKQLLKIRSMPTTE